MARRLVFSPEAQADLLDIYDWFAEHGGAERALLFSDKIISACSGLTDFPERGTRRDEIRPGLRVIGINRRLTIAFHSDEHTVTIDRLLYGGRGFLAVFETD